MKSTSKGKVNLSQLSMEKRFECYHFIIFNLKSGHHHSKYVLKVFSPEASHYKYTHELYLRESRLSKITHPNLLKILDTHPYIDSYISLAIAP